MKELEAIAAGADRVREHTAPGVRQRLDHELRGRLLDLQEKGPEAIRRRLHDIDREWDLDRAVMATFAVVGGLVHELGHRVDRRWHWLFRVQLASLLTHAVTGWCPPLPVFRRLGFRTRKELEGEKRLLERMLEQASH